MKRLVLPAALVLAFAGSAAFAQQAAPTPDAQQQAPAPIHRRHHAPNPHREAMHLSKALNLTPDQTARVEPILAAREEKMHALFSDASLAPEQRHEQLRAIHQESKQQLDAVLTPEQREQMKSMHHFREGHGAHQPMTPPPAA